MDLNHIFLFVAVISPLLVLLRAWRPGRRLGGWRIAAIIVLAITAIAWLLVRNISGYVGGIAWFILLFIPAIGLRKVSELFDRQQYRSARRLATALFPLHPTRDLGQQIRLFRLLESRQGEFPDPTSATIAPPAGQHQLRHAPAVSFFIVTNILVFLVEMARHAIDHPAALHALGALDPFSVIIGHQYWRLLTALFLHYNAVHLLFNLFALYVLGPPLERAVGSVRLFFSYLISGLGSSGGVILLMLVRLAQPSEVIGASGCIMGLVGAWAGFLIRHRHVPRARQRLINILSIVAIQTAFDLVTPQVSLAAHVCGLITGFGVGLLTAPKNPA